MLDLSLVDETGKFIKEIKGANINLVGVCAARLDSQLIITPRPSRYKNPYWSFKRKRWYDRKKYFIV